MIFTNPYITQMYSWYNDRTDCGREDKFVLYSTNRTKHVNINGSLSLFWRRSPVWQERP